MLNDAVAAELYCLIRNRGPRFWGFGFVPVFLALFNMGLATVRIRVTGAETLDLERQVFQAMDATSSMFFQMFFAYGAAAIFGGDYRWETWRLIAPRNSRANLLTAKFVAYGAACAVSIALCAATGLLDVLVASSLQGLPVAMPGSSVVMRGVGVFAGAWLSLLVLGSVVALFCVQFRTSIGAMLAAIALLLVQIFAMTLVSVMTPSPAELALVPNLATEMLNAFAAHRQIATDQFVPPHIALLSAVSLLTWIVLLSLVTWLIFRRQDFARE